jgi:HSP20 family protein
MKSISTALETEGTIFMTQSNMTVRGRPNTMLRRMDPVREMGDAYDQMNQLMREYFREGIPPVIADIEETDNSYIIEMDVPGVTRDDINVELRENELRVTGEVKERERKGILRRQARKVGQFEHALVLPPDVDAKNVDATLRDGVLTIRVGKTTSSQPRQIEVKNS